MIKKTWWIAWLLATILILLSVSSVFAAASTTGFTIWPSKTTTDVNKVWTISFNNSLLSTSVNSNTIYVTDSKQTKVATTIKMSSDGVSVTVTPSKAYSDGDYNLYITNGITCLNGVKLGEMIIVPFTVVVPSLINGANIVVTVTDDLKSGKLGDLSGTLSIEGPNGYRSSPYLNDTVNGKYTFNIFENGDYLIKYFSVSNGLLNTQALKIPGIKLPTTSTTGSTTATTVKTANLVIATKDGVEGGKSGSIGGSILPEKWGVPVKVINSTTTWTTTTDINGNFMVYLPTGSYSLVVDGNDAQYKKHSYKMTVTAGQMATPLETIKGEDPLNKLGLQLDAPAVEIGSGILGGIDATTKEIDGNVNSDATVYIYDTVPATPVLLKTVKPDTNGKFAAKFTTALTGKKLQIKVIDPAENVYILDMASAIS
ncbi:Ig-like domain-containing protein [Desulfosporosinus metallidurans]|uniref:N-acetylmuramoyl-L-alanine amidase n=1 Tax=Desulfosporosinus metallidurans TaxID=1888891 RepID=A0A1Q8R1F7_9FIRM|nr:Ig-like domain-containing protein [Desulfosporosinus metallidurans]OLN33473.1 N-acetylmuramoyl-L-alanine amidase [Desulfosporosinus metallidurans]